MRVLLIYPTAHKQIVSYLDKMAMTEPLALEYIAAGIRPDGHDVRLLDLRLHADRLDDTLEAFRPDVVAVTGFTLHVLHNLEVCARAKELCPACRTVVGGIHATFEPQDFFAPQIDFIVTGQGIQAFQQIVSHLDRGGPLPTIPGAFSRQQDGRFTWGGQPPAFDIDALPLPDRTLAPEDRGEYVIDDMKPIALMRTSVGCPFRCRFCSIWRLMEGRCHERNIADVVRELQSIPEYYIHLADDEPFVRPKRMAALAEAIHAAGIVKEYYAYSRIETLLHQPDVLRRWVGIGLRRLFIGVETIFEDELAGYDKRQHVDDILKVHEAARQIGVRLYSGFIIHPRYTAEQFDTVADFIIANGIECPSFTVWTPLPGTEDGKGNFEGVICRQPNGRPDWSQFDFHHPVIETTLPRHQFLMRYGMLYQKTSRHGRKRNDIFNDGQRRLPTNLVSGDVQTFEDHHNQALVELARRALTFTKPAGGRS